MGRSGCGKSTLVQALLRLLEAEEGMISIGGLGDIKSLPLQDLRSQISVIVQTPLLFSGVSVQDNLDPFRHHNLDEVRDALTSVAMMEAVDSLPEGLCTIVAESGTNFSQGQRQLLCLARALLRKSNILILDEPTANVDSNTDSLLQKTIKEKFSHATIISVAHRINTVIDYDRILVLGKGNLLEYGAPKDLLSNEDGYLFEMVKGTGDAMAAYLHDRAKR